VRSSSLEADSLTTQEILLILWNTKAHYRLHKTYHLHLSWARSIQSIPPSHFLKIYLHIILPSMMRSSKRSFSLRFPHQNPTCTSPLTYMCHMPRPSHSFFCAHRNNIWWAVQIMKLHFMYSPSVTWHLIPLRPNIFLTTSLSNTLSLCSFLNVTDQVSHPWFQASVAK